MTMLLAVLRTLARALLGRSTQPPGRDTATSHVFEADLRRRVSVLEEELRELKHSEVTRSAEHSAMVDQLDRLYKRISARISRAPAQEEPPDESPLALRNRLRGRS
jgi:hypothetical protein